MNYIDDNSKDSAELNSNSIVLEKDPLFLYIPAALAIFTGLLFILVPGTSGGWADPKTMLPQLIMCLLGAGAVCVGITIFRIGITEAVLDRNRSQIVLRQRFSKRINRRLDLNNIQELIIDSKKDSDGDTAYRLAFKLSSGELIPLTKCSGYDKEKTEASRIRIQSLLSRYGCTPWNGGLSGEKPGHSEPIRSFNEPKAKEQHRKTITLAAIIITFVTAAPFTGLWLASQEKPSISLIIKAGKPDAAALEQIQKNQTLSLAPNEKILWVGTPEPGREGMVKIAFLPFAIIWTLFSVLWTAVALTSALTQRNIGSALMVLWGLPFVGIGITLLASPYFAYKRELTTIYAITDTRALRLSNEGVKEIARFNNSHFGPIKSTKYNNRRMDLLFWSSLDPESSSTEPCGGFWGIEDGENARAILEEKLKTRSSLNRANK